MPPCSRPKQLKLYTLFETQRLKKRSLFSSTSLYRPHKDPGIPLYIWRLISINWCINANHEKKSCVTFFSVLNSAYFFMSHGLWLSPKNFKHLQFVNPDKTLLNDSLLLTSLMNQLETYNVHVAVSLYWYIAIDKWCVKYNPPKHGKNLLLESLIFSWELWNFNIPQLIYY